MKIGFLLKKSIFYYLFSIEIQNENIDRVVLEVTSQLIMFEGQRLATIWSIRCRHCYSFRYKENPFVV